MDILLIKRSKTWIVIWEYGIAVEKALSETYPYFEINSDNQTINNVHGR